MLDPSPHPHSAQLGKGAFIGGAWHPDSPRIGVPGILTGSAMTARRLEVRSAALKSGHGEAS